MNRYENSVTNGETAYYVHFLNFTTLFFKGIYSTSINRIIYTAADEFENISSLKWKMSINVN